MLQDSTDIQPFGEQINEQQQQYYPHNTVLPSKREIHQIFLITLFV